MKELYFKYYDELPPPIAERAKANFDQDFCDHSRYSYAGRPDIEALQKGFVWARSREGWDFWARVYEVTAGYCSSYPKIPTHS